MNVKLSFFIRSSLVFLLVSFFYFPSLAKDTALSTVKPTNSTVFNTKLDIDFGQATFSKWAAGGQDLVNARGHALFSVRRSNKLAEWDNYIDMLYGLQSLEHNDFRKTDDKYELNSKYGLRMADPRLFLTTALQFKNQFTKGYSYDAQNVPTLISAPFAPAYLTAYLGVEYKPIEGFSVFLSPFTAKMTIVANDLLSREGAYGVSPGAKFLPAYGANLTLMLDKKFATNLSLTSKLDLFSNYANVSAVVVDWSAGLAVQLLSLFSVSLSMDLIYDENVKWRETKIIDGVEHVISDSPKVQYKQLIALGLRYEI